MPLKKAKWRCMSPTWSSLGHMHLRISSKLVYAKARRSTSTHRRLFDGDPNPCHAHRVIRAGAPPSGRDGPSPCGVVDPVRVCGLAHKIRSMRNTCTVSFECIFSRFPTPSVVLVRSRCSVLSGVGGARTHPRRNTSCTPRMTPAGVGRCDVATVGEEL